MKNILSWKVFSLVVITQRLDLRRFLKAFGEWSYCKLAVANIHTESEGLITFCEVSTSGDLTGYHLF